MASRENQSMQIIAIILAVVVLCLSVALFMVNSSRKTAVARATTATENANEAQRVQREMQSEASNYKQWLGYAEADNYQDLQKSFADDMQRWGSTFEESNRSFRVILENIFEENRKLAQSEADAKAQLKETKEKLLAVEEQKEQQIAQFMEQAQKAEQDKEALRNEFEASRARTDEEKENIVKELEASRTRIDEMIAEQAKTVEEFQDTITKKDRVIEIFQSKEVPTDPYAQPADGRISYVDQRDGKVWINLGSADNLRPQVTFSVYSGDANDVKAAITKGSIEVTRILSAHMAEARITSDKATRPLMEGDKVYSQVWNRGRQVGFAITGIIDLNGDGTDDLEQLKRIIQLNNGKVDAVPSDDGSMEGEMTVDTRYLILGSHPEDSRDSSEAARQSYQTMSAEADTLNIEVITLNDFLSLMGWVSEHRAVKVGSGARSEDFPAKAAGDYEPRTLNSNKSLFRPRKPQPSY